MPIYHFNIQGEDMHHYITTYVEAGIRYAEAWLQINLLACAYAYGG